MDKMTNAQKTWLTLSAVYGNQFTSTYGDKPTNFWREGLQQFSESRISEGLKKIMRGESEFVDYSPNLTQLIKFLKTFKSDNTHLQLANKKERVLIARKYQESEMTETWQMLENEMYNQEYDANSTINRNPDSVVRTLQNILKNVTVKK